MQRRWQSERMKRPRAYTERLGIAAATLIAWETCFPGEWPPPTVMIASTQGPRGRDGVVCRLSSLQHVYQMQTTYWPRSRRNRPNFESNRKILQSQNDFAG
jgi:hypothetical protein